VAVAGYGSQSGSGKVDNFLYNGLVTITLLF